MIIVDAKFHVFLCYCDRAQKFSIIRLHLEILVPFIIKLTFSREPQQLTAMQQLTANRPQIVRNA